MKAFIALTLLTLALPQAPTTVPGGSGLEITQFSYKTKLIERDRLVSQVVSMQPPELNNSTIKLPADIKNEKPVQTIQRDTSQRMLDLNSLGIRAGRSLPEILVTVFEFQTQMRNYSSKPVTRVVWAYRPSPDLPDQEYLCNVTIKSGETKPIKLISPIPRQQGHAVVNASASGTPPAPLQPALQDLIINQVQFADGTIWERPDWNGRILLTRVGARKLKSGKCIAL